MTTSHSMMESAFDFNASPASSLPPLLRSLLSTPRTSRPRLLSTQQMKLCASSSQFDDDDDDENNTERGVYAAFQRASQDALAASYLSPFLATTRFERTSYWLDKGKHEHEHGTLMWIFQHYAVNNQSSASTIKQIHTSHSSNTSSSDSDIGLSFRDVCDFSTDFHLLSSFVDKAHLAQYFIDALKLSKNKHLHRSPSSTSTSTSTSRSSSSLPLHEQLVDFHSFIRLLACIAVSQESLTLETFHERILRFIHTTRLDDLEYVHNRLQNLIHNQSYRKRMQRRFQGSVYLDALSPQRSNKSSKASSPAHRKHQDSTSSLTSTLTANTASSASLTSSSPSSSQPPPNQRIKHEPFPPTPCAVKPKRILKERDIKEAVAILFKYKYLPVENVYCNYSGPHIDMGVLELLPPLPSPCPSPSSCATVVSSPSSSLHSSACSSTKELLAHTALSPAVSAAQLAAMSHALPPSKRNRHRYEINIQNRHASSLVVEINLRDMEWCTMEYNCLSSLSHGLSQRIELIAPVRLSTRDHQRMTHRGIERLGYIDITVKTTQTGDKKYQQSIPVYAHLKLASTNDSLKSDSDSEHE